MDPRATVRKLPKAPPMARRLDGGWSDLPWHTDSRSRSLPTESELR